ncbi:MAG: hypothetical protein KF709_02545 [Gemmatimonadaceae bacterium]|nr:hypothetical protein [Gemmatimonadaceae bacterium]
MKSVFAVLAAEHPEKLAQAITAKFPDDSLELDRGQWLVSSDGTSQHVCERIGIIEKNAEGVIRKGSVGSALVVSVSGYYGVKSSNLWEWIRAHWETA